MSDKNSYAEFSYQEKLRILDEKLSMFFMHAGIAFKKVEDPFFLDFINALCLCNVMYTPPTRQTLAGSKLNQVHKRVEEKKKELLSGTDGVLLADGWKNSVSNRKYLTFALRNKYIDETFLTAFDFDEECEFGEIYAEYIINAIELSKTKYDCNVTSIVTDNDLKIVKGHRVADEELGKVLFRSTCSSHSGNLLLKEFICEEFLKKISKIVEIFRSSKLEYLIVNIYNGTKLKSYPDTRFCYIRDTLLSIYRNMHILKLIVERTDVFIDQEYKDLILNEEFKKELKAYIVTISPICKLINSCQDPRLNVADSTQKWLSLELDSDDYDNKKVERIKKAVYEIGFAANLLHNKYQGSLMNEEQKNKAKSYLKERFTAEAYNEFEWYLENKNEFQVIAEECDTPSSYWTNVGFTLKNLAPYAIKMFLIPASTCGLEGMFSQWTYVHNTYRNRLGAEKSKALINIYHSLRFLTSEFVTVNKKSVKSKKKYIELMDDNEF